MTDNGQAPTEEVKNETPGTNPEMESKPTEELKNETPAPETTVNETPPLEELATGSANESVLNGIGGAIAETNSVSLTTTAEEEPVEEKPVSRESGEAKNKRAIEFLEKQLSNEAFRHFMSEFVD